MFARADPLRLPRALWTYLCCWRRRGARQGRMRLIRPDQHEGLSLLFRFWAGLARLRSLQAVVQTASTRAPRHAGIVLSTSTWATVFRLWPHAHTGSQTISCLQVSCCRVPAAAFGLQFLAIEGPHPLPRMTIVRDKLFVGNIVVCVG